MADINTTELDPALREIVIYHGREFQQESLKREVHLVPVDDEELERLEQQHRALTDYIFKDLPEPLFLAPVSEPIRVLDCGHGSGAWVVEVAESYPNCEVIGIDFSPTMNPDDIPENLQLQVANLNDPFSFPSHYFDLVNSRFVASGVAATRWPSYILDIKRILRPGGWVQMMEMYFQIQSDSGLLDDTSALRRWSMAYLGSLAQTNIAQGRKDRHAPGSLNTMMSTAGFIDIEMKIRNVPMSPWPEDPVDRQIGQWNRRNMKSLMRAWGLYPLTRRGGMSLVDFNNLVDRAGEELEQLHLKPYVAMKVYLLWKKAVTKDPRSRGYGLGWKFGVSDCNMAICAAASIPCVMCHGLVLEPGVEISLAKTSTKISWAQRTLNGCLVQWIEMWPRRGRLGMPTEVGQCLGPFPLQYSALQQPAASTHAGEVSKIGRIIQK